MSSYQKKMYFWIDPTEGRNIFVLEAKNKHYM